MMFCCCICYKEASFVFEGYSLCDKHRGEAQSIHNTDRTFSILTSIRYHEYLAKEEKKKHGIQSNL